MEFVGYFALIGIGVVLSFMGGGGSLLSVPILVYLFSLDVVTASSYSLFIVGITSLLGAVLKNQKEQPVDIRFVIIFCAGSVVAIFSTRKWILPGIPDEVMFGNDFFLSKRALILGVFALLVIASSAMILTKRAWQPIDDGKLKLKILLPVSITTGVLGGFVGAGGGFLILPSLMFFAGLPFKIAVGTTLLVIGFNSMLGFLGDIMNYSINWLFLLMITSLSSMGMLLGNFYCPKIPIYFLRLSIAWIMLITAVLILLKELII